MIDTLTYFVQLERQSWEHENSHILRFGDTDGRYSVYYSPDSFVVGRDGFLYIVLMTQVAWSKWFRNGTRCDADRRHQQRALAVFKCTKYMSGCASFVSRNILATTNRCHGGNYCTDQRRSTIAAFTDLVLDGYDFYLVATHPKMVWCHKKAGLTDGHLSLLTNSLQSCRCFDLSSPGSLARPTGWWKPLYNRVFGTDRATLLIFRWLCQSEKRDLSHRYI